MVPFLSYVAYFLHQLLLNADTEMFDELDDIVAIYSHQ